jgi:tRNA 5-methylaminomethyl-2-thiouridine biosynthesis bifunctional protein
MSHYFKVLPSASLEWREGQPYSRHFEAHYFSKNNALDEAHHVFIEGNQLAQRWQGISQDFVIAETGFGSGLNFLLAWSLWKKLALSTARLHFVSTEIEPLSLSDLRRCLALWPSLHNEAEALLALYPILTPGIHRLAFDDGRVHLSLILDDALEAYREMLLSGDAVLEQQRPFFVDAWFLDGFSPAKNPSLWTEALFTVMSRLSKPKSTSLASHFVVEEVEQGLEQAGFQLLKKQGYANKAEILSGQLNEAGLGRMPRKTPWHAPSPQVIKTKTALIIGGGLAGSYLASALAKRAWQVKIIDAEATPAAGASANRQAVLYPKLSAFSSPFTEFILSSYLYAVRTYRPLLKQAVLGELAGILQLPYRQRERSNHQHLKTWLNAYPELGYFVDASAASKLAGISLSSGGLFIKDAGYLDIPALCAVLLQQSAIEWQGNTQVNEIVYDGGQWHVAGESASVLILANGQGANQFAQSAHLPLKTMRGQVSLMAVSDESAKLRLPLCAAGHVLPAGEGAHGLGASYHPGSEDRACTAVDDALNLEKLASFAVEHAVWSQQVIGHWAGIRAATPDYLPLLGPVADEMAFKEQFSRFSSDSRRWIPQFGPYHPGLYVCSGFGSRGLCMIPLSAEWLAACINQEPGNLSRSMAQSLSPARFLRKEILQAKS